MTEAKRYPAIAIVKAMNELTHDDEFNHFHEFFSYADYFEIEQAEDYSFHNHRIIIIQANDIEQSRKEVLQLRRRFKAKRFILEWYGQKEEGEKASRLFDADLIALPAPWDDEKLTYEERKLITEKNMQSILDFAISVALDLERVPPKKRLSSSWSLADRIDEAADAIGHLRLNSTGHIIDELRNIAKEIRTPPRSVGPANLKIDRRSRLQKVLIALASIFDAVDSSKTASMIVSGCVSTLVGGGGWSSTACFSLAMASWFGKDAFLAAVNKLPSVESRTKPLLKNAKATPPKK